MKFNIMIVFENWDEIVKFNPILLLIVALIYLHTKFITVRIFLLGKHPFYIINPKYAKQALR